MKYLFGAAALALTATAAAVAHEGASGVVKQRMDAMQSIAGALKSIKKEIGEGESYDAAAIKRDAEAIARHGGEAMTSLFPEGSKHGPTEAKSVIWTEWRDFAAKAEDLRARADDLAASAMPGAPPTAEFKRVVQACAACHKLYREKR